MEQVRIGIIGFGGMGSHHGGYLSRNEVPEARVTAVCDVAPGRLRAARDMFGDDVQLFDTADALFAANCVDAILIATPHYFHPPLAIQGFANGLHVLSEKPAGVYTKQVREMNEAAAASDRVFALMFNQRTDGAHRKMRELIQAGELGEITRTHYVITTWFRTQAYYNSGGWRATWGGEGGGVLINQCPHNLDLWQWICGLPSRVYARCGFGKYHDIEVEDAVTAMVEYPNGATGVFVTTTGEAPGSSCFEVIGDRGKLVLDHNGITFHRTCESVSGFLRTATGGFATPESWACSVPPMGDQGGHIGITRNWVSAIMHGAPLIAPGTEGINGLQISNAIHLSAWTGEWVDIPVDEDRYYNALQEKVRTSTTSKDTTEQQVNDFANTF